MPSCIMKAYSRKFIFVITRLFGKSFITYRSTAIFHYFFLSVHQNRAQYCSTGFERYRTFLIFSPLEVCLTKSFVCSIASPTAIVYSNFRRNKGILRHKITGITEYGGLN